jgi:hypothetical protein
MVKLACLRIGAKNIERRKCSSAIGEAMTKARKHATYTPGFKQIEAAAIARYAALGLEKRKLSSAGIATATYGNSFAVATRRILGGESRRCPMWLVEGWAAISFLHVATVRAMIERDGFTIVPGRPRSDARDRDGKGVENFARGWIKFTDDGRIEYDLAKYEADGKAAYEAELARGLKSNG